MTDTLRARCAELEAMLELAHETIRALTEKNMSQAAQLSTLQAKVDALTAEPDEAMVDEMARLIAYEMGDTMGDTRNVFWSGYSFKDSARKAARAALTAFLRAARPA